MKATKVLFLMKYSGLDRRAELNIFFFTSVSRFSLFLYKMCGLEKLGLVDQNWLERNFSGFLLRTLVVGRRQHSESIEVALEWSKEV